MIACMHEIIGAAAVGQRNNAGLRMLRPDGEHGYALGAAGQSITGVLDIGAGYDHTIVEQHGCADTKLGVGSVGDSARRPGGGGKAVDRICVRHGSGLERARQSGEGRRAGQAVNRNA